MANPNDPTRRPGAPDEPEAPREAGVEKRIAELDAEMNRREEEGYDQPQSSAQKLPYREPEP